MNPAKESQKVKTSISYRILCIQPSRKDHTYFRQDGGAARNYHRVQHKHCTLDSGELYYLNFIDIHTAL